MTISLYGFPVQCPVRDSRVNPSIHQSINPMGRQLNQNDSMLRETLMEAVVVTSRQKMVGHSSHM
jgi:hypothetical protein